VTNIPGSFYLQDGGNINWHCYPVYSDPVVYYIDYMESACSAGVKDYVVELLRSLCVSTFNKLTHLQPHTAEQEDQPSQRDRARALENCVKFISRLSDD